MSQSKCHPRFCAGGTAALSRQRERLVAALTDLDAVLTSSVMHNLSPELVDTYRESHGALRAKLISIRLGIDVPLTKAALAEISVVLHWASVELLSTITTLQASLTAWSAVVGSGAVTPPVAHASRGPNPL